VRVTVCNDACGIGGAERYFLDLAEDLAANNDVRVFLSDCRGADSIGTALLSRGVGTIRRLPSGIYPRHGAPGIYRRAREAFADDGSDVLHFSLHHADSCRYWIAAAASLALPFVITEHAVSPGFLRASRLTFRMKRRSYKQARHIVFVGENARRELESDLGGVLPNASVIHPGIDATLTLETAPSSRDVVFLGRWSEQKDPMTAIRAYVEASRGIPDTTLSVFGGVPLEPEVARICKEVSPERIRLLGWSKDPYDDTRRGGIFLQTSRWENSPYAILDAMASGRTVVAYAVGDVASMLDFGNAGLPVKPNDFEAIVRTLRLAITDDALRLRLAESAPKQVRSQYDRDEMVRRTIAVYENVLV
jgi:glycosyltransferase involved in cell wall biosynthesis